MKVLNVIHSYTYKILDGSNVIGPVEEYRERDRKVANLVNAALDSGSRVIMHQANHPSTPEGALDIAALFADPIYHFIFDKRLEWAVTTLYGFPIPDRNDGRIPEDKWCEMEQVFTKHSMLAELVQDAGEYLFIGGALENCVVNAACYFDMHFRQGNEMMAYVPEVCASFDQQLLEKMQKEFEKRNIHQIRYDEAVSLFSG